MGFPTFWLHCKAIGKVIALTDAGVWQRLGLENRWAQGQYRLGGLGIIGFRVQGFWV